MSIRQLSVFLENKKGCLHSITDVLAKADIDLRSMCIADTSDYGIVRIIANKPDLAMAALNEAGYTATLRDVTAFAVPDCPGGLAKVLSILEDNNINIEYMYALVTKQTGKAYAAMRTDDETVTEKILEAAQIETLKEKTL